MWRAKKVLHILYVGPTGEEGGNHSNTLWKTATSGLRAESVHLKIDMYIGVFVSECRAIASC